MFVEKQNEVAILFVTSYNCFFVINSCLSRFWVFFVWPALRLFI